MSPTADMILRGEQATDADAIAALTQAAFAGHPHSQQTEARVIAALREAGALSFSRVAEVAGRLVGHVAFSLVSITDGADAWYGLGPMAVAAGFRRKGVGASLVTDGLTMLREKGAAGCVVLGDPDYYGRFGFVRSSALQYPGVPPEYFMALPFTDRHASGIVAYHAAFGIA